MTWKSCFGGFAGEEVGVVEERAGAPKADMKERTKQGGQIELSIIGKWHLPRDRPILSCSTLHNCKSLSEPNPREKYAAAALCHGRPVSPGQHTSATVRVLSQYIPTVRRHSTLGQDRSSER